MNNLRGLIIILVLCCSNVIHAQTTYYYKLTKKIQDGVEYTNTAGGQFVSFINNICYDSDKYGISVGNGQLTLDNEHSNNSKTYIGNSYFGNVVYRFKTDMSVLNVIVNKNLIYVYKKTVPADNILTCSLIRKKETTSEISTSYAQNPMVGASYNNSYNDTKTTINSQNTVKQKTKVRKRCTHCNGKGECIQHEYVSTFGLDGPRVYCNICNQSWSYGTVHVHHKCNHCNGTGYYEYEY